MVSPDVSSPPRLSALEAEAMQEVWARGEATVRGVLEAMNASGDKVRAYTTILTVMGHLERKGLVTRRREDRHDVYSPVMSREAYLRARARVEADALVGRFGDAAYMAFAREMDRLDPGQRRRFQRLARDD